MKFKKKYKTKLKEAMLHEWDGELKKGDIIGHDSQSPFYVWDGKRIAFQLIMTSKKGKEFVHISTRFYDNKDVKEELETYPHPFYRYDRVGNIFDPKIKEKGVLGSDWSPEWLNYALTDEDVKSITKIINFRNYRRY